MLKNCVTWIDELHSCTNIGFILTLKQTQSEKGSVSRTRRIEKDVRSQPQTPIPPSSSSEQKFQFLFRHFKYTNLIETLRLERVYNWLFLTKHWYFPGPLCWRGEGRLAVCLRDEGGPPRVGVPRPNHTQHPLSPGSEIYCNTENTPSSHIWNILQYREYTLISQHI